MTARPKIVGDPPKLAQFVEKYGDPLEHLEEVYRDSLRRAEAARNDGDDREVSEFEKLAAKSLKQLRAYGRDPIENA